MIWLLLALLGALSQSALDLCNKRSLQHLDEYTVAFLLSSLAAVFLSPVLVVFGIPPLDDIFWIALVLNGILSSLAIVLFMRALKWSPLSVTVPMLAFTPLFLVLLSPFLLGEVPSILGLIGVLVIVIGTYFLSIKDVSYGYLEPFRALAKEKGAVVMLVVALIFGVAVNFMKLGIQHSSPFFFAWMIDVVISCMLCPVVLKKSQASIPQVRKSLKFLLAIGFFRAIMDLFIMTATNLTVASYVNSIKRTSIVFTTVLSYFVFKESRITERLSGAVIMVLGIFLISVA